MPAIFLPGAPPGGMRLDSAVQYAIEATKIWNTTNNDLDAIDYFSQILLTPLSPQQAQVTETQYFLRKAYNGLKYTVGYAIADSTILKVNNQTTFDTTIQKYVDVLNELTAEDTIDLTAYKRCFTLEMDKAALLRMLGHTAKGFEILENLSYCDLDSNERSALNEMLIIYEEEKIRQSIGLAAYRSDTNFVDASNYTTPSASNATEFYFGSIINSPGSVTLRSCIPNAQNAPQVVDINEEEQLKFALFPNPTEGVVNLQYTIPTNKNAQLEVFGVNGQRVYQTPLANGKGQRTIDLTGVETGLYIYNVIVDGAIQHSGRIAVVH